MFGDYLERRRRVGGSERLGVFGAGKISLPFPVSAIRNYVSFHRIGGPNIDVFYEFIRSVRSVFVYHGPFGRNDK